MTPRKRKSPKGKKQVQEPGILSRLVQAAGRAAARHPRSVFGVSTFAVVFGFVAANALWYQPGNHPAPFLATRDPEDPNGIAGYRPAHRTPPEEVTTFRIEREDTAAPEADPAPAADAQSVRTADAARDLVAELQRQLARRGLYNGPADGLIGPQTAAAILFFEEAEGLPQTGEATLDLLAALSKAPAAAVETASANSVSLPIETVAVPAARPAEDVNAAVEDPVAAAIRASEGDEKPAAQLAKTTQTARPPRDLGPEIAASADLVIQIQRGLSNIAYTDIAVDGVAGSQTKAAIRRFEKHYRLPETGEPNELVLKKLKSIGAL
ncbi:peptidoglycan hydrolase-like protein with peptidoglycan-binding domain [Pseudorhizobium tarimense]|uniref:Peptidoglycan hydrolase-like protein with peptidoglycan-binding domain n=1 Tax=Pseudorhizobium tarimense TaxID=1079109 RepID=A0ABV2H114_9HYPH|nr:peptidoglycan-binding protein [Pseudorhizobium tarimense]MCJ8517346.1 peptidoglycan-binding protein [Pseudorhizobium tarimense]